jgi:hypothetical protein
MEICMFTAKLAAGTLAIALLAMTLRPARPRPRRGCASRPASDQASGITLVRQGRGGGRSFSSEGVTAVSAGGNRGSPRGVSPRYGGGNRAMRFDGGGSRRFARSHGVPRPGFNINPRYDRYHQHHRKHRHHRRFPGYAIYGAVPYVYDWYSGDACEDLYEKAMATGSAYWWNLYYDCRDGATARLAAPAFQAGAGCLNV